jgi:cell wall-associated NlpC family hydrolase
MTADEDLPAEFAGTALGGAVEVVVDERGPVLWVCLAAKLLGRLWPEQIGKGVVQGRVQRVIDRARSQIGVPYAWGGGNANGPTLGQRGTNADADAHGDYKITGFDCSGLMQYAFAGSGATLSRPAATEATDGEHVPWTQREPGDMLFYANSNGIHHVALYTGKNAQGQDMMVEAEESGTSVHEVPVRLNGELQHYVTRAIR